MNNLTSKMTEKWSQGQKHCSLWWEQSYVWSQRQLKQTKKEEARTTPHDLSAEHK